MAIRTYLKKYASRRLTRRVYRSVPVIGSVLAIVALAQTIRRKGIRNGVADTVLNFIPFVGGAKNLAEATRGRDFFPDKPGAFVPDKPTG
jgi:hypothetical protein